MNKLFLALATVSLVSTSAVMAEGVSFSGNVSTKEASVTSSAGVAGNSLSVTATVKNPASFAVKAAVKAMKMSASLAKKSLSVAKHAVTNQ